VPKGSLAHDHWLSRSWQVTLASQGTFSIFLDAIIMTISNDQLIIWSFKYIQQSYV